MTVQRTFVQLWMGAIAQSNRGTAALYLFFSTTTVIAVCWEILLSNVNTMGLFLCMRASQCIMTEQFSFNRTGKKRKQVRWSYQTRQFELVMRERWIPESHWNIGKLSHISHGGKKKKNVPTDSVQTHFPEGFWESRKQATRALLSSDLSNTATHLTTNSVMAIQHLLTSSWSFSQLDSISFTSLPLLINN